MATPAWIMPTHFSKLAMGTASDRGRPGHDAAGHVRVQQRRPMTERCRMSDLYETDFYSWARQQARALRAAAKLRLDVPVTIDWRHVAEEIEDMGKEQADRLESAYRIVLLHLLKVRYEPERRSRGWRGSIAEHRLRIAKQLRRNPGLMPRRRHLLEEAYADARTIAAADTGLPIATFPERCEWTLEQVTAQGFLPEAAGSP
jgi:hypothetical protein